MHCAALTLLLDECDVDGLEGLAGRALDEQDLAAHLAGGTCEWCSDETERSTGLHHRSGAAGADSKTVGSGKVAGQVCLQTELLEQRNQCINTILLNFMPVFYPHPLSPHIL